MYKKIVTALYLEKKIFLYDDCKTYTYDDLRSIVIRYYQSIKDNKLKKIVILQKEGIYLYASILASYLAWGTFCIVNSELPPDRQKYIIDSFEPDAIFCEKESDWNDDYRKVTYEDINNQHEIDTNLEPVFDNDILYISFTSGSTGVPKGCIITRKSFEKFCEEAVKVLKLNQNDICAQYVPLSFDMGLIDVFGGVMQQVALVAFNKSHHKVRPGKFMERYKVTFLNIVPQFLTILENGMDFDERHLKSLRMIRFGGDRVTKRVLDKIFQCNPNIEVVSTYGTTETTCFCCYKILNKDNYERLCEKHAVVGQPLPGWNFYLEGLDDYKVGQLVVYGDYIGEGYLDNKNEGKYVKVNIDGNLTKAYFTGDYFSYKNGDLLFVGRNDSQIKIHGKRFNMNDIDLLLYSAGASDVCSFEYQNMIITFYTDINNTIKEDINSILSKSIPSYAMPKQIIKLGSMPYNINGKFDKQYLKQYIGELHTKSMKNRADSVESVIKYYIKSNLNISACVDSNEDLKNYGLNSLDVVYLLYLVEQKLNIKTNQIFYYNQICTIENMKKEILTLLKL